MSNTSRYLTSLDFDTLKNLAENDPEEFERLRAELNESLLVSFPPEGRRKLGGVMLKIEAIRQTSGTPLQSCIKISGLMWDTALELSTVIDTFDCKADDKRNQSEPPRKCGEVVSLQSARIRRSNRVDLTRWRSSGPQND